MTRYMSYDHANWVQMELAGKQGRTLTKRDATKAADKKGWHAAPKELNDFHKRAFNILGIVGGGIYNAPIGWNSVRWCSPRQIIVPWLAKGFGTWDFNELTLFTLLCHTGRIRGYIAPCNNQYLNVWLSERTNEGQMALRHPNLQEAIEDFQGWYWQTDPVTFPGDRPFPLKAIREAITAYHHALDTRQDGTLAGLHLTDEIQDAMGMPWIQGATLPPAPVTDPPAPIKADAES